MSLPDYLQDDFDPTRMTIPRLRNILLECSIALPSAARKADLVDAYDEFILPQKAKLRTKKAKELHIKADGRGIRDMTQDDGLQTLSASPRVAAAQSTSASTSESETDTKASAKGRKSQSKPRGRPTKSSHVSSGAKEIDHIAVAAAAPVRSPSPQKKQAHHPPSILSNTSDREDGNTTVRRKSSGKKLKHRSSVTFNPEVSYREIEGLDQDPDATNFSAHNPFQSGSPDHSVEVKPTRSPAKRRSSDGPRVASPAVKDSSQEDGMKSSKTLPTLRNFVDPIIAASTPPRIVDQVARRIGSAVSGLGSAKQEESDAEDDDVNEEDEEAEAGAEDEDETVTTNTDESSFDIRTDPSPSIHALREKRKRQSGRSSLSHEATENLWRSKNGQSPSKKKSKVTSKAKDQKASELRWARVRQLTVILAAFYTLFAMWVRATESQALGYCDIGSESNSIVAARQADAQKIRMLQAKAQEATQPHLESSEDLLNITATSFIPKRWLPETCTACPTHGDCRNGEFKGCTSRDFLQSSSLASKLPVISWFAPLKWLAPTCTPDTQKLVLALELGSELEKVLADWHGQVLCGYSAPHEEVAGGKMSAAKGKEHAGALPADALREDLFSRMDQEVYDREYLDQLWSMALEEYERSGEIKRLRAGSTMSNVFGTSGNKDDERDLLYVSRALTPLTCTVRLQFKALLRRFRLVGVALLAAFGFFAWTRRNWRRQASEGKRVKELVQVALERLQEQEYQHAVSPSLYPEPFLATAQLRDHVLATEHSTQARKRLWNRVAKVVEENANVRTRQAQRRGEWARVWEWIGAGAGAGAAGGIRSQTQSPAPEMAQKQPLLEADASITSM